MAMKARTHGAKSDINVTPYIDILLVLLIIFMVIQPTTKYDLKARTPQEAEDLPDNVILKQDTIVVQVAADGTYRINQDPITLDQMGKRLFEIYSARSNKNMFIQGEDDLPFGDVIRVIDIAKGAGVGDIGLISASDTRPSSGSAGGGG